MYYEDIESVKKAIYNTHSNSDHIGGNKYLQGQTECDIYAPGIECDFTNHTILEPAFLYGGYAPKDLKHKFILAQESVAQPLTNDNLPEGWEIIDALEFGSASAAMLVASHACSQDMPSVDAVKKFIADEKAEYGEMIARA